jgi:hypothetical protein
MFETAPAAVKREGQGIRHTGKALDGGIPDFFLLIPSKDI